MTTPKLALPELVVGQAGKELTHNQALAILAQLVQANVVDKDLSAPPVSPADGAMYIVAAGATGAWSGQSGKLAYWLASVGAWTFASPVNGWSVWVTDEAVRYELKAGAWSVVATGGGGGATLPVVQALSASRSLALVDINTFNVNSTVSNYTATIPAQATVAWTADAEMHFLPSNTGDITITTAAGVSLNGVAAGSLTLSTQNGAASIKRIGSDSWWCGGVIGSAAGAGANLLYNSLGSINQRGYTSSTATTAANEYTIDRYRVVVSGQNLAFVASGNGFIKTAPAGGVEQVIEGINIAGGSYVISWTGTATASVNGTARTNGEAFTLPANTNATVRFSGGTFQNEKVEVGTVATSGGDRPYSQELTLCQRYYWKAVNLGIGFAQSAGDGFSIKWPTTMRAIPTLSNASFSVGGGSPGTATQLFFALDGGIIYNSASNWTPGTAVRCSFELTGVEL